MIFSYFFYSYFLSYGEFGELIMKLSRAALRPLRARSLAIGRSGLGCHCEKGEPPTPAAHARGALPFVRAAWGVTVRKASHNASNARGVAAGKMGSNSSRNNDRSPCKL